MPKRITCPTCGGKKVDHTVWLWDAHRKMNLEYKKRLREAQRRVRRGQR